MRLKNEHVRSEPHRIEETKPEKEIQRGDFKMAKKSRGGRMTSAKKRAAKRAGGRGPVRKRAAGRNIMKT
jgi:hypothetical protein